MKFDSGSLSTLMLQLRCAALRWNPLAAGAAALFVAGGLCLALWLPLLHHKLASRQIAVARVLQEARNRKPAPAPAPSENEVRVQQFYANLGDNGYAEQQLKTLFDIAAGRNLMLNEGQYQSIDEKNSDTIAYQIQLPVTGPYPAIREFCEQVLQTIPFAALDEISFKREAIGNSNLEARLRFTLYLAGSKKVAAGAQ